MVVASSFSLSLSRCLALERGCTLPPKLKGINGRENVRCVRKAWKMLHAQQLGPSDISDSRNLSCLIKVLERSLHHGSQQGTLKISQWFLPELGDPASFSSFFSYSSVAGRKQLIRRRRLAHLGGWSRGRAGSVKNVHL